MEKIGLNKVDLIFEKVDEQEVLTKAYNMTNEQIIQQMLESGLKGRGGAGFPTGLKWKYAAAKRTRRNISYVMLMKVNQGLLRTGRYSTGLLQKYMQEWLLPVRP